LNCPYVLFSTLRRTRRLTRPRRQADNRYGAGVFSDLSLSLL
jgi:hypothetical protein